MNFRPIFPAALLFAAGTVPAAGLTIDLRGLEGAMEENAAAYLAPIENEETLADTRHNRARIEDAVKKALRALGHYEPQVRFTPGETPTGGPRLTVDVVPGTPVRLAETSVVIRGAGEKDPAFQRRLKALPETDTILNHGDYDAFKSSLAAVAMRKGYFDAQFLRSELGVSLPLHEAYWTIDYETGERYKFGPVTFEGSQIDEAYLRNLIPFDEGDPYHANDLAELSRRLSATGWFASAVVSPDFDAARESGSHALPLHASVVPKKANSIETGLGYATDVGPRGSVTWNKPWVNRRGHSLSSTLSLSKPEQVLDLSYKIPERTNPLEEYWIFQGGYKHTDLNDTQSDGATLLASRWWELSDGWQRDVHVRWTYDSFTQGGESHSTMLVYPGVSFSRTRARGGLMPHWGDSQRYSFDVSTEYLGSDVNFFILQAQQTWIRTYARKHRFVVRAGAGWIKTSDFDKVPPDLRFFVGGDRSVRGYDYKSISPKDDEGKLVGAAAMITGSLEYQFNVTGKWWGAAFFDMGEAVDAVAHSDFKRGAGVGIRWLSPVGPVKFDIARPIGDSNENDLQFYIGLGSEL